MQPRSEASSGIGTVFYVSHCMFYTAVAAVFNTLCYDSAGD